jgi:hypothetical protein
MTAWQRLKHEIGSKITAAILLLCKQQHFTDSPSTF